MARQLGRHQPRRLGGTVVNTGGTLQLQNIGTESQEYLTLNNGPGFNNAGALENFSGNNIPGPCRSPSGPQRLHRRHRATILTIQPDASAITRYRHGDMFGLPRTASARYLDRAVSNAYTGR